MKPTDIRYTNLPGRWPGRVRPAYAPRPKSPYKVVTWAPVERLLLTELAKLGAKEVEIALDLASPMHIRNDGGLRSDARTRSPGVILRFTRRDGVRLQFPCDTYGDWTVNMYAIARTLEKLRLIDRDGVTQGDAQYVGFRALPPGGGTSEMTVDAAAAEIARHTTFSPELVRDHRSVAEAALKIARAKTHPDSKATGGTTEAFQNVERAWKVLEADFGAR